MAINEALAARCGHLAELSVKAGVWADENQDLVRSEYDGLQRELRRAGRLFRTCEAASRRKMCAGVFGPSQSGKSYLISALARDADGGLLAEFSGETHDFISEINPVGGKESTGLVTRFTTTRLPDAPSGFPVRIRLLTETDLVKILANTYYADCEHRDTPDPVALASVLDALEKQTGATPEGSTISLDMLEDLQEYLVKDFRAKPRVQELERGYWNRVFSIGPRLRLEDRIRMYSLIWDEVKPFTELLRVLACSLEQLGHAGEAFVSIESLIPRDTSIIDVAMLEGLGTSSGGISGADGDANGGHIDVVSATGAKARLPRAVVTALTAELAIVMREQPDPMFEHTDLLDFPGYRSRYKIDDLSREAEKPGMVKELFLRGKVAYLFQRYCAERELTSMLLCIGPSNQEVQDLPGVINDWVLATHGETPESRREKKTALYFILTKFDMEFEQKKGAPSVETRWDTRLHVSLIDFFGKQHDWPHNWDGVHGFNNLFLLRNPNFRFDAILNYDQNGNEKEIRPDQQVYVDELHAAFLNSDLVAAHFKNPRESWDAAMCLNDGGINHIRMSLRPLCDPEIKKRQIETSLQERQARLLARLKPFWKTDDKEEARKNKNLFFRKIATSFAELVSSQRFGELLYRLGVRDHELYDLAFEAESHRISAEASDETSPSQRRLSGTDHDVIIGSTVNADDILGDLFGGDPDPLPIEKNPQPRHRSAAQVFTDRIMGYWFDVLHRLADDPVFQGYYGLSALDFSAFISELTLGAERIKLGACIAESLQRASGYVNIERERLFWKQASLAAGMINAYINWLGYNPRLLDAKDRTLVAGGRSFVLFEPPVPVTGSPHLEEEQNARERVWVTDWLRALLALFIGNVDFDGEQTFNPEQNRILGEIIRDL